MMFYNFNKSNKKTIFLWSRSDHWQALLKSPLLRDYKCETKVFDDKFKEVQL